MDYAAARYRMVENQLRPNRVSDARIVAAMAGLPRERFVPPALQGIAYVDDDLALGNGRYLMEPLVVAQLLQAATIDATDSVLEIGCGLGYSTAVLASAARQVIAVDDHPTFAAAAAATLDDLGFTNVEVVQGDLRQGWPPRAPFDVIVFGGAVGSIPEPIFAQLAEGGRLVAVIRRKQHVGKGTVYLRAHGIISSREVFDAATPMLSGFETTGTFEF